MSKYCTLRCLCGERADIHNANWKHRELWVIAQSWRELAAAAAVLNAHGLDVEPGWQRTALWFCEAHAESPCLVEVVDEYGAVWPCACGGNHTGPCR